MYLKPLICVMFLMKSSIDSSLFDSSTPRVFAQNSSSFIRAVGSTFVFALPLNFFAGMGSKA